MFYQITGKTNVHKKKRKRASSNTLPDTETTTLPAFAYSINQRAQIQRRKYVPKYRRFAIVLCVALKSSESSFAKQIASDLRLCIERTRVIEVPRLFTNQSRRASVNKRDSLPTSALLLITRQSWPRYFEQRAVSSNCRERKRKV